MSNVLRYIDITLILTPFIRDTKEWELKLLRSPIEICGRKTVESVKFAVNEIIQGQDIIRTDKTEVIECGLVLRSVGYKGIRIDEALPFNEDTGLVTCDDRGRILGSRSGMYCSGWAATGPKGVIVDTMNGAFAVAETVAEDIEMTLGMTSPKPGGEGLKELLKTKKVVTFDDWVKIDAEEIRRGKLKGKLREKIVDIDECLSLI